VEEISQLKRLPGGDMLILGSATLASSVLQAGLIDEYRVIVNPIALGSGKPLLVRSEQNVQSQEQVTKGCTGCTGARLVGVSTAARSSLSVCTPSVPPGCSEQ